MEGNMDGYGLGEGILHINSNIYFYLSISFLIEISPE